MPRYVSLFLAGLITAVSSVPAMAANRVGEAVVLRTLDKVTATTEDFTVKIGDTLTYGSLKIDVKHCEKKPPEEIPETFAFVQIFEARLDKKRKPMEDAKLFSGWMLSSSPAMSALDHAVYDVWVLGCTVPQAADEIPFRR